MWCTNRFRSSLMSHMLPNSKPEVDLQRCGRRLKNRYKVQSVLGGLISMKFDRPMNNHMSPTITRPTMKLEVEYQYCGCLYFQQYLCLSHLYLSNNKCAFKTSPALEVMKKISAVLCVTQRWTLHDVIKRNSPGDERPKPDIVVFCYSSCI